MNVLTRGVKNALRSPLRSGAIVLMFAISIALILSMLVARSSVQAKINEVKATAGTNITIRPAGVMGGMGGGNPLTAAQLTTIESTANVSSTTLTLTDQMGTDDTNLESSQELGAFGQRQMRFESSESSNITAPEGTTEDTSTRPAMTPRITVTGTNDVNSVTSDGGELNITSGTTIDADGEGLEALVGSSLATKNSLEVGDTFTAYGSTVTVKGIYTTDNAFQDSGIIMPLTTLQTLTDQADVVNTVIATVNSSDNVASTVESLKTALGDDADITSEVERAQSSVESLESISSLALAGVIGAAIAGAAIVLLAMIMVVRERRREIGVMKAVGGTDGKVVGQFTIEGLTLTLIGTVIGIVLGVLVSGPMTTSLVSSQSSTNSTQTAQTGNRPTGGPG
ncbi:MAG: FtsX-like permease family protein, partial [Candidatus Microsaccharimonas sp.]